MQRPPSPAGSATKVILIALLLWKKINCGSSELEAMEPKKDVDPPQDVGAVQPREVWEKLPQESQKAFNAFVLYRDAEKRSFKNVAEKLNCSPQNIFQWSSKFNWRGRCDAFDIEQDRVQRAEFARSRVRMRERHVQVARAMLNVAGHALHEWQNRIAGKLPLDLAPETIALLTKCATELERSTLGVDDEQHRPAVIKLLFGTHKYSDEKADSGEVDEGNIEWKSSEDVEREEYEKLNDDERRTWDSWKNPPQKKLTN